MTSFISRAELFTFLEYLEIKTTTREHAPVFTVEDGAECWADIPGVHCKNLFLRDAGRQNWLLVAPVQRRIDLKALPDRIGSRRLSFGSADRLWATLGVRPGSVTPFALLNDRQAQSVRVVLDAWMMQQPLLNFHPLENTATTTIAASDLRRFLEACGHVVSLAVLDPEAVNPVSVPACDTI